MKHELTFYLRDRRRTVFTFTDEPVPVAIDGKFTVDCGDEGVFVFYERHVTEIAWEPVKEKVATPLADPNPFVESAKPWWRFW